MSDAQYVARDSSARKDAREESHGPEVEPRTVEELLERAHESLGNQEVLRGLLDEGDGLSAVLREQVTKGFAGLLPSALGNSELIAAMANPRASSFSFSAVDWRQRLFESAVGDGMSVEHAHSTVLADDGIEGRADTRAQAGWSPQGGLEIDAGYAKALRDQEDYEDTQSIHASYRQGQGKVERATSSSAVDAAGTTRSSESKGHIGYSVENGFFGGLETGQKTDDGQQERSRSASLAYQDGTLLAGMNRAHHDRSEEGVDQSSRWGLSASMSKDAQKLSGERGWAYESDGVMGSESWSGQMAHSFEDGLSLLLEGKRNLQDGEEYHNRTSGSMRYGGGSLELGANRESRGTDDAGVRTDRDHATSFKVGQDGVTVSHKRSSERMDDGVSVGSQNGVQVHVGPNGQIHGKLEHERKTGMGEDYNRSTGGALIIGTDRLGVELSQKNGGTDANGHELKDDWNGSIVMSGGKVSASGQRTLGGGGPDGGTETTLGGGLDSDGTIRANAGFVRKDKDGKTTGGLSGSGQVRFDDGGLSVGAGAAATFKGGKSVSGSVGYDYTLEEPMMLDGGRWAVRYQQSLSGNVGAGLSKGSEDLTGSVNVNGGLRRVVGGTRVFESEEAAKAFYDKAEIGLLAGPTGDIEAVRGMAPGEVRSVQDAGSLGGSVSGGGVSGSAQVGVSGQKTQGLTVTRGEGSMVEVTLDHSATLGGQAGAASIGIGGSVSASRTGFGSTTWSFDLDQPEAQQAYRALVEERAEPAEGLAGVVQVSGTTGKVRETGVGMDLGLGSGQKKSTRQSTETLLRDGTKIEEEKGKSSFSVVRALFGGDSSESHELSVTEINDADRFMASESVVQASDAGELHSGLARAAGIAGAVNMVEGSAEGQWTYQTAFPDAAVDEFIVAVKSGTFNPYDLLDGSGHGLVKALDAAGGDSDREREVLADFVAAGGDKALAQIRRYTGGDESFLHLENSETFTGVAGHRALERQLSAVEGLLAQESPDAAAAFEEAQALHTAEIGRERDLMDHGRYVGLPDPLRQIELVRVRDNLARLEAVMGAATELLAASGDADAILLPDLVEHEGENLADAQEGASAAHVEMEDRYSEARDKRFEHNTGMQPRRKRLGHSGVFGWAAGSEYQSYLQIDLRWPVAEEDRREGSRAELQARENSLLSTDTAAQAIPFWREAERAYGEAKDGFDEISDAYDGIKARDRA